jgi:hypothetical protein
MAFSLHSPCIFSFPRFHEEDEAEEDNNCGGKIDEGPLGRGTYGWIWGYLDGVVDSFFDSLTPGIDLYFMMALGYTFTMDGWEYGTREEIDLASYLAIDDIG